MQMLNTYQYLLLVYNIHVSYFLYRNIVDAMVVVKGYYMQYFYAYIYALHDADIQAEMCLD